MSPREEIIGDIQRRLWEMTGAKLVSRNLRLVGGLKDFPAIFIVDLGDQVESSRGRPMPTYTRNWKLSIMSVVKGSKEEKAPSELAAFQDKVRSALYKDGAKVGKITSGHVSELSRSQLTFPETGNVVVTQNIEISILYVDDVSSRL